MSRVNKAIAGGVAGGVAAVTGFAITGEPLVDQAVKLVGTFVGGFVVGFVGVWLAPANSTPAARR